MRISDWSSDVCSSDLKDENGYTETYDEFHTVKAFNGLGKSVANHKKKGDKLMVVGEIRYSRNERDGRTYYNRSEEHTSELQSLMRISYAVFCLKKKKTKKTEHKS